MYRAAFENFDVGYASAIAMLLFTINVALIVAYLLVFRRTDTQAAL
jgi:ABC-type sugar transport system permease subunit